MTLIYEFDLDIPKMYHARCSRSRHSKFRARTGNRNTSFVPDPVTFIYELDPYLLKVYQQIKNELPASRRQGFRKLSYYGHTNTHTDKQNTNRHTDKQLRLKALPRNVTADVTEVTSNFNLKR